MSTSPDNKFQAEPAGASDESLLQVHAKLQSQKPEKANGYSLTPLVLLGIMCTAIFFGSIYMAHYSIRFDPLVVNEHAKREKPGATGPVALTRAQLGKKIFVSNCATCHQLTGQGIPGQYPPLVGSEWVLGNEERIARIVLHGLGGPITVEGKEYNNIMPQFGAVLKDEQIANALSYIRAEWGNQAAEVQPETIAKVRSETASRTTAWTAAELKQIGKD
jgi:mono/diheme cytochrome c family protein